MLHLTYIEEYASSFVSFGVTHDVGTCESKEHFTCISWDWKFNIHVDHDYIETG